MWYIGIRELSATFRGMGLKIGFVNGCFDVLHEGHHCLLSEAAKVCDILIIAINSDSSVRKLKGKDRPTNSIKERITNLKEMITGAYFVIEFSSEEELETLANHIRPYIMIKGDDYRGKQVTGAPFCQYISYIPRLPFSSTDCIAGKE